VNIVHNSTRTYTPQYNNNQYTNMNNRYYEEDEDECDDCSSDASGQTIVHNDCPIPPVNATQEEINKFYWEWCYGNDDSDDIRGSNVFRTAPVKSW